MCIVGIYSIIFLLNMADIDGRQENSISLSRDKKMQL